MIDPAGGNSSVTVNDTSDSNTFNIALGDTTTVAAGSLLPVSVAAADTGTLALNSVAFTQFVFSGTGGPGNITVTGGVGNTTGTAQVSSGPLVSFTGLGSGGTSLVLNGLGGGDSFDLTQAATGAIPAVTANGGGTSSATVRGNGAADSFAVNFGSTTSVNLAVNGAAGTTYGLKGLASDLLDGIGFAGSTLTFPGVSASVTPGSATGSGTITPLASNGLAYLPVTYVYMANPATLAGAAGTTLTVNATDDNDTISVDTAGTVTVTNTATGATNQYAAAGYNKLVIDDPGNNSLVDIAGSANFAGGVQVSGNGATTFNYTAPINASSVLDLAAGTITSAGANPISFTGVSTLNLNAGGGALTVADGNAAAMITVTPTAGDSATLQADGSGTLVNAAGVAGLTLNLTGAGGTLAVNGTSLADTFTIDGATLTETNSSFTNTLSFSASGLQVNGASAGDTFNVTPSSTAVSIDGGDPVGVSPGDTLNIVVGAAPVTFAAGPTTDSGGFAVSGNQPISFVRIESLGPINGTGPAVIQGTNGNDSIQVTATGPQSSIVSVNQGLPLSFVNVPALYIDTLAGADQVNVTGPTAGSAYNWNEEIFLAGASHAAGSNNIDSLTVETPRSGGLIYTPTAAETGVLVYDQGGGNTSTVTSGAFQVAAANYNSSPGGFEQLAINGESAGDALNVVTPTGPDTIVYNPGATTDAAAVAVGSLLPLSFTNLGPTGTVSLADASGGPVDTLTFNGTAADDNFAVSAGGVLSLNSQLAVSTPGVSNLTLNGLAGSDTFTLNAALPYTNVAVNGGSTANSDDVVLQGATGAIAVSLANQSAAPPTLTTITGYGGTVSLCNIAEASLNGSGADRLSLTGTSRDDQITYQPTSASGGNFSLAGLSTAFSFNIGSTPANTFVVFGGGNTGSDQVNVRGPNAGSTFIVVEQTGVVTVSNAAGTNLMPVTLGTDVQTVELDAGAGNNTFLVDPAPGLLLPGKTDVVGQPNFQVPNNLLVNIVGGGAASQNVLIVAAYNPTTGQSSTLDAGLFAVVNRTSNTGGVVRVFRSNGPAPGNEPNQFPDISYAGVGTVSANTAANAITQQQQTLTLGPDLYDPNGSLNNAAYLGSGAVINAANLAIFPNAFEHKFLQAEQDWFRLVAQSTGTMDFQVYFNQYAGFLPGNGELQIQVYDSAGHEISDFGVNDQTSDQRRRIPVVAGETYYLQVYGVSQDATKFPQNAAAPDVFDPNSATVNGYSLSIVNTPAPTPDALGLNSLAAQGSNSPTRDNRPTIYIRLDAAKTPGDGLIDLNGGGNTGQTPPDNVPIPIPFWAGDSAAAPNSPANNGSFRVAVYDVTAPHAPVLLGYANAVAGETGVFQLPLTTPLADGTHNLVAKVEMDSAGTPSNHDVGPGTSLQAVIDTQSPVVYFGSPSVPDSGLAAASDSGIAGQGATIADRLTTDSSPTFFGGAEANAVVRLYVSTPSGNVLIGQATATPNAGTAQSADAQWTITSAINLNDPSLGLPHDGARNLFVTAEDAAGNVSAPQELTIFLDTQGPQLASVNITGSPAYKLFDAILGQPTPTPLVSSLDVTFTDQPARVGPDFVDPAVNPTLATTIGNYQLVGKRSGPVQISSITLADSTTPGSTGETVATLHFAAPLADDIYSLTISDKIEDNAGNALDGEFSGAYPSGNSNPGGVFSGAFTVNSHPHLAVYTGGSVALDINGNGVFDPSNTLTNSDAIENFGYASDRQFAGNFADPHGVVSGFDELGAYGFVNNQWRWLLNLDPATGTSNPTTFIEPLAIDGTPVAGYFAGNRELGMQVGLFDGTTWYLDVLNHHTIDAADLAAGGKLSGNMRGEAVVGDFDGDGKTDLATYQNGVFYFDLSSRSVGGKLTGNYNATLNAQALIPNNIGYSPLSARPVAADIDQDGITDIGLYVPGSSATAPNGQSEWFWLVSNDSQDAHGANPAGAFAALNHVFNPTPLGHDLTIASAVSSPRRWWASGTRLPLPARQPRKPALEHGATQDQVVTAILSSTEFISRSQAAIA